MRADLRSEKIGQAEYDSFIKEKIREVIRFQEEIGLDVLVHGEFERTDMVEFFAEKLEDRHHTSRMDHFLWDKDVSATDHFW